MQTIHLRKPSTTLMLEACWVVSSFTGWCLTKSWPLANLKHNQALENGNIADSNVRKRSLGLQSI
jgi:hypothetical protein